ncbi:MAG: pyruvate:ferredoxin (flavodoxin) oxidoreductase [Bacilli bacterium]
MKTITVDGNEACSNASYLFTEVAGIYPITPSSPMAEHIDEWSKQRLNIFKSPVKVVEMQSEAGAAGFIHGSLQAGCLTTTYTSSQGLLLMIPNMYKMAGEMLPAVIHVAARSLSTHALSIMGDHQDIYATRATGFCMLASSNVEQANHLGAIAHMAAIKASLPFLHFFDGFRTSHEINKINILEKEDLNDMIPTEEIKKFRNKALNPQKPQTIGTAQMDDIYFQATEVRNKDYNKVSDIVNDYMEKINKIANTNYKPFNYYGHPQATNIIVAMGSVNETIKETITYLIKKDYKIGLIEVHLYRPFSPKYFKNVLPKTVKKIAVLDRTKEPGSKEPLYLDICDIVKNTDILVVGGRYGLSGKDTNPNHIIAVFDMLNNQLKDNFTIGINDDLTNLSLKVTTNINISTSSELLIYGYGSDGMISAAKSIIKLIGNNTQKYVQGYFEYDSKKSGGMTISHLRFNDQKIQSTYYVTKPNIVVVSKDNYLNVINPLINIEENGTFILNTTKTKEEINNYLPNDIKTIITKKNIKFYIINAASIATKVGLKNKISIIMESAIIKLSNIINYDEAIIKIKEEIISKYLKKGQDIVNSNILAIDQTFANITKITIDDQITKKRVMPLNIYEAIKLRQGNLLPTSAFIDNKDGHTTSGTSKLDKRGIANYVPKWINENCITCNKCALICPHGVIIPFLLNENEYIKAPEAVKNKCIKDLKGDYFCLGISVMDCTGCGLCIKACPGKQQNKALITFKLSEQILNKEQEVYNYLINNIKEKDTYNINTIKGSQFKKPKFMFSGACAGCGETAYLKLLTQLFGENLMISNATGCSSIYGASAPCMPYEIPWASSLFEDNAEYGYGMIVANNTLRNRLKQLMKSEKNEKCQSWLKNSNDYQITHEIYQHIDEQNINQTIKDLKEYIINKNIWIIGGDGWAYDIGFGGIDHILSSTDNINILVLDSEVYSNTGGQASKATPKGSIASFSTTGKITSKKNLAKYALTMPHVYVATINLGANQAQTINALKEASSYNGPSIVIAYSSCIAHGIKGGLENSLAMNSLATKCGYFPLFRYSPINGFKLDSQADFILYEEYINNQSRYNILKMINKENQEKLLNQNKEDAQNNFKYYQSLVKKD